MNVQTLLKQTEIEATSPKEQFKLDVLTGLSAPEKCLSSKYFYDDRGSELYSEICNLEEYYPFAAEMEVFQRNKTEIAKLLSKKDFNLIELGAGDARKTKILLSEFLEQGLGFKYVPIDISESALLELKASLAKQYPSLQCQELVGEYFAALNWMKQYDDNQNLVLFLGSNIGNFNNEEAKSFLRTLWASLNPGDLVLIGFDLKKDIDTMLHAYNDSKGVTKQFNLNLLTRINNELDANFDISKFDHFGTYNARTGAMESYIVSMEDQVVNIKALDKAFNFAAFEAVHLEYSFKYLPVEIEQMAQDTGFEVLSKYSDSKDYFLDYIWQVKK